jgi:cysteine-rich repeat protein
MASRSLRLVTLSIALAGCPSGIAPTPDGGRDAGLDAFDPSFDANIARLDAPLGPDAGEVCGDGMRTLTEACDDGDVEPGDGCSPSCEVEPGFRCLPAMPCRRIVCGDRLIEAPERCDDGNASAGDGCSDVFLRGRERLDVRGRGRRVSCGDVWRWPRARLRAVRRRRRAAR